MPLMILWLCRVWLLASRGELHEDPVVFALTDRMSLLIGVAVAVRCAARSLKVNSRRHPPPHIVATVAKHSSPCDTLRLT